MSFLKAQGIRGLAGKNDWPRFVEEESEVYEREELDTLFAVCDEQERLWYESFLMTGMREQEVMHCSWADVSLSRSTITVRYKPEYGFSVSRDAGSRGRNQSSTPAPTRLILPTFPTTEMPTRR
jgi:integrase